MSGTANKFRAIVGGERRDCVASAMRAGLRTLEIPYASVVGVRNFLYDNGFSRTVRLPIPIVSVGNLTLGGTGKTPMVAWLAEYFLKRNTRPGIISRGYGKGKNGVNDEYLELAFRLPTVPHRQNPDRVAAAEEFLWQKEVDVLILDDAFQHRRIERDLDIVLLDASEPFGFDHVFPGGTLRESVASLRRADAVLLSRADRLPEPERLRIRDRVRKIAPEIVWGEVAHIPESLVSVARNRYELAGLHGKRVLGFCGIGNPAAFRNTLESCGADVVRLIPFPDHHRFTLQEIETLEKTASKLRVDAVVCTMKDLVKIESATDEIPILAISVQIQFLDGENLLRNELNRLRCSPPE